jgi:cell division protein FtsQ
MIKKTFQALTIILLAILFIVSYNYLKDPEHLPVRVVNVEGRLTHLTQAELQALIEPYVAQSFIAVDIKALRQVLQANAWVKSAQVRRTWPDTVTVEVVEQVPIAYWGEHDLVNEVGERFMPTVLPKLDVPYWQGPSDQLPKVHEMYAVLNQLFSRRDVKIASLSLNARWSWHAVLDSGLSIALGSQDVPERVERFVATTPIDLKAPKGVQYVDLRYTNGFVVNQAGRE